MKNASFIIFCCILAVIALPLLLAGPKDRSQAGRKSTPFVYGGQISVYDTANDQVLNMDLEEYVWRVVASEMPVSFHEEALKAQAVAARTYAIRRMGNPEPAEEHKGAQLCTNPAHCAAFMTDERAKEKWGDKCEAYSDKVKSAAQATAGEIVEYNEQPATTVFYAMSSGKTENAKDVWGGDVPYLVSVDSSADEQANGYETTKSIPLKEVGEKLGITIPAEKGKIIGEITNTEGGSVDDITLCGQTFKGTAVRSKLGLRSANFIPKIDGDNMVFTVYGYGHGVGMSQVGADAYAKEGYTYKDILAKYYPGTMVVKKS